jgi:hypothetical protein
VVADTAERSAARLLELELDADEDVTSPLSATSRGAGGSVEEPVERVLLGSRARWPTQRSRSRESTTVVARAQLGVREHLVGLGDLEEAIRRLGLARDIRVVARGKRPEGFLDRVCARTAWNAEHGVVIAGRPGQHGTPTVQIRAVGA